MTLRYQTIIRYNSEYAYVPLIQHCRHGKLHRVDGPAILHTNGATMRWYQYGCPHRDTGPVTENRYFRRGVEYDPEI
jgi:hypothetical protein